MMQLYPPFEKGDVILIQGDGVNQKLIGVVKCVDDKEKTVCQCLPFKARA